MKVVDLDISRSNGMGRPDSDKMLPAVYRNNIKNACCHGETFVLVLKLYDNEIRFSYVQIWLVSDDYIIFI